MRLSGNGNHVTAGHGDSVREEAASSGRQLGIGGCGRNARQGRGGIASRTNKQFWDLPTSVVWNCLLLVVTFTCASSPHGLEADTIRLWGPTSGLGSTTAVFTYLSLSLSLFFEAFSVPSDFLSPGRWIADTVAVGMY